MNYKIIENRLSASRRGIPLLGRDITVDAAAKRKFGEVFSLFWPLRQGDEAGSVVPGIALPIRPNNDSRNKLF
jgi:hypothetical protein